MPLSRSPQVNTASISSRRVIEKENHIQLQDQLLFSSPSPSPFFPSLSLPVVLWKGDLIQERERVEPLRDERRDLWDDSPFLQSFISTTSKARFKENIIHVPIHLSLSLAFSFFFSFSLLLIGLDVLPFSLSLNSNSIPLSALSPEEPFSKRCFPLSVVSHLISSRREQNISQDAPFLKDATPVKGFSAFHPLCVSSPSSSSSLHLLLSFLGVCVPLTLSNTKKDLSLHLSHFPLPLQQSCHPPLLLRLVFV